MLYKLVSQWTPASRRKQGTLEKGGERKREERKEERRMRRKEENRGGQRGKEEYRKGKNGIEMERDGQIKIIEIFILYSNQTYNCKPHLTR